MSQDTTPDFVTLGDVRLTLNDPRLPEATRAALTRGRYEFKEREIAKRLLANGDRVVELGTGMGAVCLTIARLVGESAIRSFEANPTIADLARHNAGLNGLKVDIRNAIPCPRKQGRAGETMEFYAFTAFEASSVLKLVAGQKPIQVPTVVLEDEIASHGANTLVFDVEGFEKEIVTLGDLGAIDKIVAELHPNLVGDAETVDLVRRLEAQGLKLLPELMFGQVVAFARRETGRDGAALYARTLELERAARANAPARVETLSAALKPELAGNAFAPEWFGQIGALLKAAAKS